MNNGEIFSVGVVAGATVGVSLEPAVAKLSSQRS